MVEVSDTGTGIPEKELDKIFNPFYTTKTEGVGLGLSICSRLISENGGKIDVTSKVNEGTTFILALPAFLHH
jgi:signal transduction histidine kinase